MIPLSFASLKPRKSCESVRLVSYGDVGGCTARAVMVSKMAETVRKRDVGKSKVLVPCRSSLKLQLQQRDRDSTQFAPLEGYIKTLTRE